MKDFTILVGTLKINSQSVILNLSLFLSLSLPLCLSLPFSLSLSIHFLSFLSLRVSGTAEQPPLLPPAQEADHREAFGPVPAPGPAQRRAPQGFGNLRNHLQNHRDKMAGQGPVHLQVCEDRGNRP